MLITVTIAKLNETVDFDTESLPVTSTEYVMNYGLTQAINDAAASVVRKNFASDTEFQLAVREKCDKRISQVRTGDVPGSRAPASPANKLGRQVAAAAVEAGIDVSKIDPAKLLAALRKMAA